MTFLSTTQSATPHDFTSLQKGWQWTCHLTKALTCQVTSDKCYHNLHSLLKSFYKSVYIPVVNKLCKTMSQDMWLHACLCAHILSTADCICSRIFPLPLCQLQLVYLRKLSEIFLAVIGWFRYWRTVWNNNFRFQEIICAKLDMIYVQQQIL